MSSDPSTVDAATVEQTKQQIRGLVREIAQLSKGDLSAEQFYTEVMHRIVTALAAVGGAVWTLTADRRLRVDSQINFDQQLLDTNSEDSMRHLRLLQQILTSGEPRLVPPRSAFGEQGQFGNPTDSLLVLAPLRAQDEIEGVIEIFQRPDALPQAQQGYLRFLVEMSEYIGDWLKSRKLQHYVDRQNLWTQIDSFTRAIHESLDVKHTAYTVANEGRRLIGCDRLSVAIRHGAKDQIEAISGQDVMDSRSNVVQLMRNLTRRVTATGEPLWYDGTAQDLPPQVESALHAYVDECHTKSIAVLPLRKPLDESKRPDNQLGSDLEAAERQGGEVIGALIVEHIESRPLRSTIETRAQLVCHHSARAIANSMEHSNLFLMPVWKTLGKATWLVRARTLPKTLAVTGLVLATTAILTLVQADFNITAPAYLDPTIKQQVFFNAPGNVRNVHVEHGDRVKKGQLLVDLQDPQLEQELTKLQGDRATANKQFTTAVQQLQGGRAPLTESEKYSYMSQREQALSEMSSLDGQIRVLEAKQKMLQVVSPIDGTIISWEIHDTLIDRPVQRGERAMEIADTEGSKWDLVIKMPEKRMGHVTRAVSDLGTQALNVLWVLKSNPNTTYVGKVKSIYPSAEWDEQDSTSVVKMRVDIGGNELPILSPQLTATAKVQCGRGRLGYVLFHDIWEWIQINVLFRFK
ncbi:MAG: GAF domain-containing protein [Planctomycetota bacterium]|nr:GAF domain-containing protein [Planctomycetota bacterium]MDA1177215.1 GAF domain-containing protein [Planctomycetota bacterium]